MEHLTERRIYYHHTDAGGVVYYTAYLEQFEEARAEFFLSRGINIKDLADAGIHFVVASVQVSFRSPAFFYDLVRILTRVERVGTSSVVFNQQVRRDAHLLVDSQTAVVCVGDNFKPRRIPPEIRQALTPDTSPAQEGQ